MISNMAVEAIGFLIYLFAELSLIFIVMTFFAYLAQEYMSAKSIESWLDKRSPIVGNLFGAALGLITPFGSCSTIPIVLWMMDGKMAFGTVISFLIASPILNPFMIILLVGTMGFQATILYVALTFFSAVIVGHIAGRRKQDFRLKGEFERLACNSSCSNLSSKLRTSAVSTLKLFAYISPYLLVGAALGAFIFKFVPGEVVSSLSNAGNIYAIPTLTLIGIPIYMRGETMIPIAHLLVQKGMATGTVAALIISGAGISIPEMVLLSSVFKRSSLIAYVLTMFVISVSIGYVINAVLG